MTEELSNAIPPESDTSPIRTGCRHQEPSLFSSKEPRDSTQPSGLGTTVRWRDHPLGSRQMISSSSSNAQ